VLSLPYPGGPNLEKLALNGNEQAYLFPKAFRGQTHLDFSFSGPKTAVINLVRKLEKEGAYKKEDIAASFQRAVVHALTENALQACEREKLPVLAVAGGVSSNTVLRETLKKEAEKKGIKIYAPEFEYCVDNAAMIGAAAYWALKRGQISGLSLNARPQLELL
jgi:N6-L-threonylcarbamoyladenine synthase